MPLLSKLWNATEPVRRRISLQQRRRFGALVPRKVVICAHAAGFFSNFNKVLNHLVEGWKIPGTAEIAVDWSRDRIRPEPYLDGATTFNYGRVEDGNLWERFFAPISCRCGFHLVEAEAHHYVDMSITHAKAEALYRSGRAWRDEYHAAYRRHVHPLPTIVERVDALHACLIGSRHAIGVHVRDASSAIEQPSGRMPTFEQYAAKVAEILRAHEDAVIFVATDVEEALDRFRARFGDRVVCQEGARRSARHSESWRDAMHLSLPAGDVKYGEEVLVEALMLARCEHFVHCCSNLATAVYMINPEVRMAYCEP